MQGVASLRHLWHVGATLGAEALRSVPPGSGPARRGRRRTSSWRKQLALYREREVPPRRATDATRRVLVLLARVFPRRDALLIVQPATLIRWHGQAFRLFWRWRSRGQGRP